MDIKRWTTVIQATSDAQKLFRVLYALQIKGVYSDGEHHLRAVKKFAERNIRTYFNPKVN